MCDEKDKTNPNSGDDNYKLLLEENAKFKRELDNLTTRLDEVIKFNRTLLQRGDNHVNNTTSKTKEKGDKYVYGK
jgi:ElaB/YqjD/DUF883 family membrane-anchored ribosome-binding protein